MSALLSDTPLSDRIAGAPISWGVSEVAGWGRQLPVGRVLSEMREIGLTATELGPDGFLPEGAQVKRQTLAAHGLQAVAQFVPVVLHDAAHDPVPEVEAAINDIVACGGRTVVLAAATGVEGYDERPPLTEDAWSCLVRNLDWLSDLADARDLTATLHPHVGTMIETGDETARVLEQSRIGLCLDTGHLVIGGGDPVELARAHPDRITHVHLKDVRVELAEQVRDGRLTYTEAVGKGIYRPLGSGDVAIDEIVNSLEGHGYSGWYVLEQDTVIGDGADQDPKADVQASVDYLHNLHNLRTPEPSAR